MWSIHRVRGQQAVGWAGYTVLIEYCLRVRRPRVQRAFEVSRGFRSRLDAKKSAIRSERMALSFCQLPVLMEYRS
jgi:hypothetical protein